MLRKLARRIVLDPVLRRYGTPSVQRMLHSGGRVHLDAPGLVRTLTSADGTIATAELDDVDAEWDGRVAAAPHKRTFPPYYNVERETARCLYLLARALRPAHVLETGVANGRSSFFLLTALQRNGSGELHSLDVRADAAPYLTPSERAVWHFTVVERRRSARALERALESVPALDLFVHDSDHSYRWQRTEYAVALSRLQRGGILASDDADASYAFCAFCEAHGLRAEYLFDRRKLFGAARV